MFFTLIPVWSAGLLLVGVPMLFAVTVQVLLRRSMGLERLRPNNEVAGFKFAVVGVLYAVLLAFAVIVVWEKFSEAHDRVSQEAGAVATIYRLARGIDQRAAAELRGRLDAYLAAVITTEWPTMERAESSPEVTRALQDVYSGALMLDPVDRRGEVLLAEILRQLDLVTQSRRARLVAAAGTVPGVIWFVLFAGAVITVGFAFFFAAEDLLAQTMMTGALCGLVFSGLLVIVVIDRPFAGSVKVSPEALVSVLNDLGSGIREHP
jgi:Protein of unknown function (DUF4239)